MDQYESFKDALEDALADKEIRTCRGCENYLIEHGVTDISFRRVSDYRGGLIVPPLEKAKAILTTLDFVFEEQELIELLERSKIKAKEEKAEFWYVQRGKSPRTVFLDFKHLISEFEAAQAEEYLNGRIEELFGDKKRFSAYVNSLIRKDLKEYIISKNEVEEVPNEQ